MHGLLNSVKSIGLSFQNEFSDEIINLFTKNSSLKMSAFYQFIECSGIIEFFLLLSSLSWLSLVAP